MNLFLLRHGLAVEPGAPGIVDDSTRPVTSKGRRQLRQTAVAMKIMNLDFDLIVSSPFLRAKQTAEIIAENLKLKKRLKFSDALTPDGDMKVLIRQLNKLKPALKSVLLVGHEPYLSQLISLLISGSKTAVIDFKKGGLCKLEIEKPYASQCARLAWLLTPKQMKLIS